VNHVAGAYMMGALTVIAFGSDVVDTLGIHPGVAKWLTILCIAGFPVAVAASWAYDIRVHREGDAPAAAPYSAPLRGRLILLAGIGLGMMLLGVVALLSRGEAVEPAATAQLPAVAVLPVELEGSPGDAWMTRALQVEVSNALGASRGITARSYELVDAYAGMPVDSLARALTVDYLVAARLVSEGGHTHLTVQLLDPGGTILGSIRALEGDSASVGAVADLTTRTVDFVLGELGVRVRLDRWRLGTRSEAAFNLMYRADELMRDALRLLKDPAGARTAAVMLEDADALLRESAEADPRWDEPLILRMRIVSNRAFALRVGNAPESEIAAALDRGIAIATGMLARDAQNAQALAARGSFLYRKRSYVSHDATEDDRLLAAAEADLRAALRSDGGLAQAAAELSNVLWAQADFGGARSWAFRALQLDAYLLDAHAIMNRLAMATFETGEDTAALRLCREAVERFGDAGDHGCVIEVLAFGEDVTPDVDAAWHHLEQLSRIPGVASLTRAYYEAPIAAVLARAGQPDSAARVLARARARFPREFEEPSLMCTEAAVRFRMGQADSATALLRAYLATGAAARFNLARRTLSPYRDLLAAEPPRS
jgi:tetratricopeptide (TPR) repeat protein/TolB-like protein